MATVYNTYSNSAITNGLTYRTQITYSTVISGSYLAVSGTISLQAKGTFSGSVSSSYKYVRGVVKDSWTTPGEYVDLGDKVGETAKQTRTATSYSSWTTLKTASFSYNVSRYAPVWTTRYIYGAIEFFDADNTTSRGLFGASTGYSSYYIQELENYYIVYHPNGGSGSDVTQVNVEGYDYWIANQLFSRTGAAFVCWNTSADGSGTTYYPSEQITPTSGFDLYAIWVPTPQITGLSVIRCDQYGADDDEGTYAKLSASWNIDQTIAVGASATVTGSYTPQGGTETQVSLSGDTSGTGGTATALVPNMDPDQQYTYKVTVTCGQKYGSSSPTHLIDNATSRSVILSHAFFIMDFAAGGAGIGIGRAAPVAGLEVGYDAIFDGDVLAYEDARVDGDISVGGDVSSEGDVVASGLVALGSSGYTKSREEYDEGITSKTTTIIGSLGSPLARSVLKYTGDFSTQVWSNNEWTVSGAASFGSLTLGTIDTIEATMSANTAAGTTASWSYVRVKLTQANIRTGSSLSLATSGTNRYAVVVSKDGWYMVSGHVSANAPFYAATRIDGSVVGNSISAASTYSTVTMEPHVRKLSAGAVIDLAIERSTSTDPTVGGNALTKLIVARIG